MRAITRTLTLAAIATLLACSSDPEQTPYPSGVSGAAGTAASGGSGGASAAGSAGAPSGGASTTGGSGSAGAAGSFSMGGASGSSGAGGGGGGGVSGGGAGPMAPGEALFRTNCLVCHGELGVGTDKAPDIQHPIRDYTTWVVRNGRAVTTYPMPMKALTTAELSDADLTLIFDYLSTPPKGTTGQALFKDFCANCHGADAKGGVVKHNLLNETDEIPMRVRMGAHAGEYQEREEFMPVFTPAILTDAEVQLIQDYVESL